MVLSENKLEEIPASLAGLKALRVLRLQNNKLKTLPYALSAAITLEELDCSGNTDLDIIPPGWHSDVTMILWVCRLRQGRGRSGSYREHFFSLFEVVSSETSIARK